MITTIYHKANGFTVQLCACKYCWFSNDVTKNSNNKTSGVKRFDILIDAKKTQS